MRTAGRKVEQTMTRPLTRSRRRARADAIVSIEPLEPRVLLSAAMTNDARAAASDDCHAAALGDINGDGVVDIADLSRLAGQFLRRRRMRIY